MTKSTLLSTCAVLGLALFGFTSVAHAQVADSTAEASDTGPGEEIIVTGSRIRRDPLDQSSPVITLDQTTLAQTGLSAVADILQRLPSAAGGLNTKVNNSGNIGNPPDGGGVGAGSSTIDLRYLGAKRTLVLVDGLRFVNGTSASGIPATVVLAEHLGDCSIIHLRVDGIDDLLTAKVALGYTRCESGQTVALVPDASWALRFGADGRLL